MLVAALLLAGCGTKGELRLPDPETPPAVPAVATKPAEG
jgi:predicted small lipoprotein YifL